MNKLVNYTLVRDFYKSRFDTYEDNLNKGKSYQDSVLYSYDLAITFLELSQQLKKFSYLVNKFSSQIKDELSERKLNNPQN